MISRYNPTIQLLFEPRDLWVGIFWDLDTSCEYKMKIKEDAFIVWPKQTNNLEIYICLLPMLPIKLQFIWVSVDK